MKTDNELKTRIKQFAQDAGADIIGFAPAERWDEYNEVPPDFRPQSLWEPARSVIVIGVSMPLPIVETTPSFLHRRLMLPRTERWMTWPSIWSVF